MTDTTTNETTDKTPRAGVAKHELIAAPGGEHVAIDKAVGIRYIDKATNQVFEFPVPLPQKAIDAGLTPEDFAGSGLMMLALFGAKTKATNEASRVRNGDGGGVQEQLEAIDEVFENIAKGVWREKAEGGGGSRTDKAALAAVLIEFLEAAGKHNGEPENVVEQRFIDGFTNAAGKTFTGPEYLKFVLSNDAIKSAYRRKVGKTGPAADDLA